MIPSVRFDEIYTTNTCLYFAWNIWVPSFARCRLTNGKPKVLAGKILLNFVTKKKNSHKIIYQYMTFYGYIIMAIVDSCIIWFQLDCIMQLMKSYYITTNVCSRKVLLLLVISLTDKGPINNIPALVQIMAWRRSSEKPLSELMLGSLLTHICVTRPQWVNKTEPIVTGLDPSKLS